MKLLRLLLPVFLVFGASAQQRIGIDANSNMNSANLSLHYQRVINGPLLFSGGINGGLYGVSEHYGEEQQIRGGFFSNPFPEMGNSFSDALPDFVYRGNQTKSAGISAFVGLGLFKEFENHHGIRFNLHHYFSAVHSKVLGFYRNFEQELTVFKRYETWHPVGAWSMELYHTIRLTGRNSFYWGLKTAYSYTLDESRYAPTSTNELFQGFQTELSLGITHSIGSCN